MRRAELMCIELGLNSDLQRGDWVNMAVTVRRTPETLASNRRIKALRTFMVAWNKAERRPQYDSSEWGALARDLGAEGVLKVTRFGEILGGYAQLCACAQQPVDL